MSKARWFLSHDLVIYPNENFNADRPIATVNADGGIEQSVAIGNLIAAAPEMLEALERIKFYIEQMEHGSSSEVKKQAWFEVGLWLAECHHVIAKAEGKS